MKNKLKELDVDFIGGQEPMTKDETLAISEFIKTQKNSRIIQHGAAKTLQSSRSTVVKILK